MFECSVITLRVGVDHSTFSHRLLGREGLMTSSPLIGDFYGDHNRPMYLLPVRIAAVWMLKFSVCRELKLLCTGEASPSTRLLSSRSNLIAAFWLSLSEVLIMGSFFYFYCVLQKVKLAFRGTFR